jgi:hypothetical protein
MAKHCENALRITAAGHKLAFFMEGFLLKAPASDAAAGLGLGWHERFFVHDTAGKTLMWFEDPKRQKKLGELDLRTVSSLELMPQLLFSFIYHKALLFLEAKELTRGVFFFWNAGVYESIPFFALRFREWRGAVSGRAAAGQRGDWSSRRPTACLSCARTPRRRFVHFSLFYLFAFSVFIRLFPSLSPGAPQPNKSDLFAFC